MNTTSLLTPTTIETAALERLLEPLDPPVRQLVAQLNRLNGLETTGSCGGHAEPGPCQWPAGDWYVNFRVRGDIAGLWLRVLEVSLRDLIEQDGLEPDNFSVRELDSLTVDSDKRFFALEGYGVSADDLAACIAATIAPVIGSREYGALKLRAWHAKLRQVATAADAYDTATEPLRCAGVIEVPAPQPG